MKKNRAEVKADKGDSNAQFTVGFMYLRGEGCEKDLNKAKAWFEAAAEQEDADTQYNLGLMFDQSGDVTKAKKWYKRATDKDHEKARNNLDALNYRSDGGGSSSLRIMPIRDETFVDLSNRKKNKKSGGAREGSGRKKAEKHLWDTIHARRRELLPPKDLLLLNSTECTCRPYTSCHHCSEAKQREAEGSCRQLRVLFYASASQ